MEVTLSMLGSHFRVVSDDERVLDLVRVLWGPFLDGAVEDAHEAEVDAAEGGWYVRVSGERPIQAADPWVLMSSLRNSLSRRAIDRATGIVPLHGAAVERDGLVVVLSGPPRTGKTTLLLDLLERGWLLVTDDLVPLDPATLTAAPFPKPLSVRDPARWERFATGWDVPEWLPPPSTVGLIPATALAGAAVEVYDPSVLVFPRFTQGAAPELRRLTAAQLVARVADNLHTAAPTPATLGALARLGTLPGFTIEYGTSEDALNLLRNCLAGVSSME